MLKVLTRGESADSDRQIVSRLKQRLRRMLKTALSAPNASHNLLAEFVKSSQPWSRERVRSPAASRALWALYQSSCSGPSGWRPSSPAPPACRGPICTVITLDHHAAALLACGVLSVAGLGRTDPHNASDSPGATAPR